VAIYRKHKGQCGQQKSIADAFNYNYLKPSVISPSRTLLASTKSYKHFIQSTKMLAVFDKTVAKCPDALQSPHSAPAASVLKDGFLANHLASLHPGSVTVNLGTSGLIAYSLDKQNPLLPRYFFLFCLKKCDFFFWFLGLI